MTTCQGVSFAIVQRAESSGKTWPNIVQHCRLSGLEEEPPYLGLLHHDDGTLRAPADQMVKRVESKDVAVVILCELTSQCDALQSSSDQPTRDWMERAVIN